jgi:hypothetical protein
MPPRHDLLATRGNDLPVRLRLTPLDGTGADFRFTCRGPARPNRTILRRSVAAGTMDLAVLPNSEAGTVATTLDFTLDASETRRLGEGRVNSYELEYRLGDQQRTLLAGFVTLEGGVNDDA